MRRILVCGGRDYTDARFLRLKLDLTFFAGDILIHGAARGADSLAADWAAMRGYSAEAFPADWDRIGHAAGAMRNQQMLDSGVDLVIAFPGGRGTADMVRRAKAAGVEVMDLR